MHRKRYVDALIQFIEDGVMATVKVALHLDDESEEDDDVFLFTTGEDDLNTFKENGTADFIVISYGEPYVRT